MLKLWVCLNEKLSKADFPGETPEGAEILVSKLKPSLRQRFPGQALPRVIMTDRGKGFFRTNGGSITPEYAQALRRSGFRALQGDNAGQQCGNLGDMMLHETAVSWLRDLMTKSTPKNAQNESRDEYVSRLRDACRTANAKHHVQGLCKGFNKRLQQLVDSEGDRTSN